MADKIEKILGDPLTRFFGMIVCFLSLIAELITTRDHSISGMGFSGSGYWIFAGSGLIIFIAKEIYAVRKFFFRKND